MTVAVGFLGTGLIARFHELVLSQSSVDHRIAAVYDPDAERGAAFAEPHGAAVLDEAGVIERCDAVYVTTWTSEHQRLVEAIAAAGKAVFCEKPLAFDGETAEAMVDSVTEAGVTNQVGLVLRFSPPFRWVRHLLSDERAGRPLAVTFRDDQFLPIQGMYGSTWRADLTRAGRGVLLEHSIHDVDILRWWLGPVAAVSGGARSIHGIDGIDDVVSARIDFESGATATLVSVWHDILERPSMRYIELFCEGLYVAIDHDFAGPVRWQFTGEAPQSLEGVDLEAALREIGDRRSNPATSFLRAVEAGEPSSPDLAAAVPAHRIVDAIYRSADAGGELVRLGDQG